MARRLRGGWASCRLILQRGAADQHRVQLDQFCLVLVRVMLAEEKFGSGLQLGTHSGGGAAPITSISPREFRTGQSRVHWYSVSALSPLSQKPRLFAFLTECSPAVSFVTLVSVTAGWGCDLPTGRAGAPVFRRRLVQCSGSRATLARVTVRRRLHPSFDARSGSPAGQSALPRSQRFGAAAHRSGPVDCTGAVGTCYLNGSRLDAVPAPAWAATC